MWVFYFRYNPGDSHIAVHDHGTVWYIRVPDELMGTFDEGPLTFEDVGPLMSVYMLRSLGLYPKLAEIRRYRREHGIVTELEKLRAEWKRRNRR
jgi:hypothetical protein